MNNNKNRKNNQYPQTGRPQQNVTSGQKNCEPLTEENYVDLAEKSINEIKNSSKEDRNIVTTSQLRNLLTLTMEIYNELVGVVDTKQGLSEDLILRMNYLKLRFVYECGRTPAVKTFVETSQLLKHLEKVLKDQQEKRKSFILFTRYMEALVAYRKYLVQSGD